MDSSKNGNSKGGETEGFSHFPSGIEILCSTKDPIVDIVFAHGLTGDRVRTWTSQRKFWPKDFLKQGLPIAKRVMSFGYDAYIVRTTKVSTNRISDHARDLLITLAAQRMTEEESNRPIVFVAHSLGGLVCKVAILTSLISPEPHLMMIAPCTRAILFMGTPHTGSALAAWAKIPIRAMGLIKQSNKELISLLEPNSEMLSRIQMDFLDYIRQRETNHQPISITCLFEELPLGHFMIVPKESVILPGYNYASVHANHKDMAKFETEQDPGYLTVLAELERWTKEIQRVQVGLKMDAVLRSLPFPGMGAREATIEKPTTDSCGWILTEPNFQAWVKSARLEDSHGLLWIKGNPGSGKSTLMKYLVENPQLWSTNPTTIRLRFFFNARGSSLEKSPEGLYRTLMYQLIRHLSRSGNHPALNNFYSKYETTWTVQGSNELLPQLLRDAFHDMILAHDMPPIEVFVDGLDECDDQHIREVVKFFSRSASKALHARNILKICWASRYYPHVSAPKFLEIRLQEQNYFDIQRYVHQELMDLADLKPDSDFENEIVSRSRGIFLWAVLVVRKLLKAVDQGRQISYMRKLLRQLPQELNDLLHEIHESIDQSLREESIGLIQIVLFSPQPFPLEQLPLALAFGNRRPPESIEAWESSLEGFEKPDAPPQKRVEQLRRYVMTLSGGLIEAVSSTEAEALYLQVIHECVRDFFLTVEVCNKLGFVGTDEFKQASHLYLTRMLSNYLLVPELRCHLPETVIMRLFRRKIPKILTLGGKWLTFTQIALRDVFHYFNLLDTAQQRLIDIDTTAERWLQLIQPKLGIFAPETSLVDQIAHRLTDFDLQCVKDQHAQLIELLRDDERIDLLGLKDVTCFGLDRILDRLHDEIRQDRERRANRERRTHGEHRQNSALVDENITMFEHIVKHDEQTSHHRFVGLALLLSWSGIGNFAATMNALTLSIEVDVPKVVQFLMDHDRHRSFIEPLFKTTALDRRDILEVLLKNGADVNTSRGEESLLLAAAENGCVNTMRVLLDWQADKAFSDYTGRNALMLAAQHNHYHIAQLLLAKGIDVNLKDMQGRTALFQAGLQLVRNPREYEEIAKLLLRAGASLPQRGNNLLSPLDAGKVEGMIRILEVYQSEINETDTRKLAGDLQSPLV